MLRKLLVMNIILPILVFIIPCGYVQANTMNTIKLALLDTPYNEMSLDLSLLSEYEKAYLAGVETAAHVARKYNLDIKYKPFFYGEGPLDILKETPKIQTWQADFVLGPSSSDQFTLLKNFLPNMMVLSSYCSGKTLQTLPNNFYSIFLPDSKIMALLADYIHKKYPEKNIYVISQADCKQCIDVSTLFVETYRKNSATKHVTEAKIIMDNIDSINSKKLMLGHENDVTLIFNVTYYAYNNLVKHIAASFPGKKQIFFSDEDNWGSEANHHTLKKDDTTYESYRIGPLLMDESLPDFKKFSQAYHEIYQTKPTDAVSYMTYITIMSAVESLNKFPKKSAGNSMRERILQSYLAALKKNPDWFKVKNYGIYRLTSQGEVLVEKLPI